MSDPSTVGPSAALAEIGLPDLSALDGIEAELDDVARALERLDEGTYGTCEVCGATLPDAHLDTAPAARRCHDHTRGPTVEPAEEPAVEPATEHAAEPSPAPPSDVEG